MDVGPGRHPGQRYLPCQPTGTRHRLVQGRSSESVSRRGTHGHLRPTGTAPLRHTTDAGCVSTSSSPPIGAPPAASASPVGGGWPPLGGSPRRGRPAGRASSARRRATARVPPYGTRLSGRPAAPRFVDVVRDGDDGLVQLPLQAQQFVLGYGTDHRVGRTERPRPMSAPADRRRARGRRHALHCCPPESWLRVAPAHLSGAGRRAPGGHRRRPGPILRPQPRSSGTVAMLYRDGAVREEAGLLDDVADGAPQLGGVLLQRRPGRRPDGAGGRVEPYG